MDCITHYIMDKDKDTDQQTGNFDKIFHSIVGFATCPYCGYDVPLLEFGRFVLFRMHIEACKELLEYEKKGIDTNYHRMK